jgi:low affinity Fe/Cu permease
LLYIYISRYIYISLSSFNECVYVCVCVPVATIVAIGSVLIRTATFFLSIDAMDEKIAVSIIVSSSSEVGGYDITFQLCKLGFAQ